MHYISLRICHGEQRILALALTEAELHGGNAQIHLGDCFPDAEHLQGQHLVLTTAPLAPNPDMWSCELPPDVLRALRAGEVHAYDVPNVFHADILFGGVQALVLCQSLIFG